MIKRRGLPNVRCVTRLAVVTELRCHMVWIRRLREIAGVTLITIGVCELVVPVDMT
jgi:hypothetical protein